MVYSQYTRVCSLLCMCVRVVSRDRILHCINTFIDLFSSSSSCSSSGSSSMINMIQ